MTAFLAPALVTLRDEVNAAFPKRDKTKDGWIGDPAHATRKSDHNPCRYCTGRSKDIVRALDIDITPDGDGKRDLAAEVLRAAIGDPRVWYVIHKGKIYSRTHGWRARVYAGDPHDGHVHISLNGANGLSDAGNFDTAPWGIKKGSKAPAKDGRPPIVSLAAVKDAARHPQQVAARPAHVKRVQRALNARLGTRLIIDGVYGPSTRDAVRRYQRRKGKTGAQVDGVMGRTLLTALGRNRFTVVP